MHTHTHVERGRQREKSGDREWKNEREGEGVGELYAVEVASIHGWDLISLGNLASYTGIVQGISSPPPNLPLLPPLSSPPTHLSLYTDYVLVYTHFDILVITLPTSPHLPPPFSISFSLCLTVDPVLTFTSLQRDDRNFSNGPPTPPVRSSRAQPLSSIAIRRASADTIDG